MTKLIYLWLIVAQPKQSCLDAAKPRSAIVTIEGTTETFKSQWGGRELKPKTDVAIGDRPNIGQKDPCYDYYISSVKTMGELQVDPKPKVEPKKETKEEKALKK